MKKVFAVLISVVMLLALFTSCLHNGDVVSDSTPTPEPTPFSPVDVTDTMSDELKAEFESFVNAESFASNELHNVLKDYDCTGEQDMRQLTWSFFKGGASLYLNSIEPFAEYYDENTEDSTPELKVKKELVDFVMKEYYNLSQEVPEFEKTSEDYGIDSMYYQDGFYYMSDYGMGDLAPVVSIDKIYDLNNNRYYFEFRKAYTAEDEFVFTDEPTYYVIMERKTIDNEVFSGFEFWSIIRASTESIKF